MGEENAAPIDSKYRHLARQGKLLRDHESKPRSPFHGGNGGSNPPGDAKQKHLASAFDISFPA